MWATTIEGEKTILLQRCDLRKFMWEMVKTRVIRLRVIKGPNARDQIVFCALNSALEVVQTKLAKYVPSMRSSNLGPVVQRAISTNPGLNFLIIFVSYFKTVQSSNCRQKELTWYCVFSFHIWIQISHLAWVILTSLWTAKAMMTTIAIKMMILMMALKLW